MNVHPGRGIAAALLAAGLVAGLPRAAAGDEATSGSFRFLNSFVRDYVTFEHAGRTITGGPLRGTVTVTESSGGPFVEGESGLVACLVHAKRSEAGLDLEAPCTHTDPSGDQWYVLATRKAGDTEAGGGGAGRRALLGGTGKYAGVTGSCTYSTSYLTEQRSVSRSRCEWTRP